MKGLVAGGGARKRLPQGDLSQMVHQGWPPRLGHYRCAQGEKWGVRLERREGVGSVSGP